MRPTLWFTVTAFQGLCSSPSLARFEHWKEKKRKAILFLFPAAIIIGREITIASLREWMAEIGKRAQVQVSVLGKWKTSAQMLAIGFFLYRDDLFGLPVLSLGYGLLYVAAILTLWSMIQYLQAAFTAINSTQKTDH